MGPSHAPPIMMILKNLFPTVTLLSVAAAQQMCPNSPPQLCRMMCPPTNCPSGHCAMRKGRCCSMSCVKRPGSAFASSACMDNESAADKLCKGSCSDLKNSCGKTLSCGPRRVNVAKLCPKTCGMCSKKFPPATSTPASASTRASDARSAVAACMCPNSPPQICRMMCRPKYCPAGQCAMREGNCCNMKCVASGDH